MFKATLLTLNPLILTPSCCLLFLLQVSNIDLGTLTRLQAPFAKALGFQGWVWLTKGLKRVSRV